MVCQSLSKQKSYQKSFDLSTQQSSAAFVKTANLNLASAGVGGSGLKGQVSGKARETSAVKESGVLDLTAKIL